MSGLFLGVGMLSVFALVSGSVVLWKRDRQRAWLMLACAIVILANVLIWTL